MARTVWQGSGHLCLPVHSYPSVAVVSALLPKAELSSAPWLSLDSTQVLNMDGSGSWTYRAGSAPLRAIGAILDQLPGPTESPSPRATSVRGELC